MPAWSVLLRLLLAAALVFNGVSTAAASVHLGHLGAMDAVPPAKMEPVPTAAAEEPPCHGHHHAAMTGDEHPAVVEKATTESRSESPDCCKSGLCRCACVHHAPAAIIALSFAPPIIEHADSVRPMSAGHATPALPHLIRPPIG